ncbi:MAG: hypothetical protein JO288_03140 [Hyphomicrobiales bacterium]|nr:hypothetical protein [Hyphomicrobiales bacterium]
MRKSHQIASGLLPAAAIVATLWSPAVSDELRPIKYKVTLLEQVRHEFIIEAHDETAARTFALLEAGRTLGSRIPAWKPRPPTLLAHVHEGTDFAVIDIEPLPSLATPEPHLGPVPLEIDALGGSPGF